MENLKCPECGKPMVEVEKLGTYGIGLNEYNYRYKAMQCADHKNEWYQTEFQVADTLKILQAIKATIRAQSKK